jgi:hypothetical protein
MADFLNHLIQRSGISPTRKENAPVLQPRLLSLFEALANADELSVLPSSGKMTDSQGAATLLSAQLPFSEQNHARAIPAQAESMTAPGRTLKSAETSFEKATINPARKKTSAVETGIQKTEPKIQAEQPSTSSKAPASTVLPSATSRITSLEPAYIVQSRQARRTARSEQRGISTLPADASAPRGSREDLQRGSAFSDSEQAEGRLTGPADVKQTAADGSATRQVIRPRVESARPDPVSATSQTTAASLSNGQTPAEETVVQIRIGRIDVHAAQPPAPSQPTRTTAPQPKMTLEDYLRRRENQQ